MDMNTSLFLLGETGHDATLWILLALSVVSVSIIIERYITYKELRKNSDVVASRIKEVLRTNDTDRIETVADDWSSLEGRALNYGLRHIKENGEVGLDEMFDMYRKTEKPRLEKNLSFLATVGSNAPFIGLLGTVLGIMHAFRALSDAEGDPSVVMSGISEALVATAAGLMVALPAVIAFNYFKKQQVSVLTNLDSLRDLLMGYAKTNKRKS